MNSSSFFCFLLLLFFCSCSGKVELPLSEQKENSPLLPGLSWIEGIDFYPLELERSQERRDFFLNPELISKEQLLRVEIVFDRLQIQKKLSAEDFLSLSSTIQKDSYFVFFKQKNFEGDPVVQFHFVSTLSLFSSELGSPPIWSSEKKKVSFSLNQSAWILSIREIFDDLPSSLKSEWEKHKGNKQSLWLEVNYLSGLKKHYSIQFFWD